MKRKNCDTAVMQPKAPALRYPQHREGDLADEVIFNEHVSSLALILKQQKVSKKTEEEIDIQLSALKYEECAFMKKNNAPKRMITAISTLDSAFNVLNFSVHQISSMRGFMIALQENDEPFLKLKENINSSMNQLQSIGVKHIRLGLEQENIVESSDSLRNSLSQLEQFEKEAVDAVDKISMLELSIEKTERSLSQIKDKASYVVVKTFSSILS